MKNTMGNMGIFLGKSLVILTVLYGFYNLYLANSTKFNWNRLVLWTIMVASICFPFISIEVWEKNTQVPLINSATSKIMTSDSNSNPAWTWTVLGYLYLVGILYFLVNTLINLTYILHMAYSSSSILEGKYIIYQSKSALAPCSFFNWIFVRDIHAIDPIILEHEKIHADQYHSLDLMVSTVFKALLWVHPFAHKLCRDIKTNHEYICDEALSIQHGKDALYQLLMAQVPMTKHTEFFNQFSSYLKNRVTMMFNAKILPFTSLRYATCLFLLLGMFSLFSFKTKYTYTPGIAVKSELDTLPVAIKQRSLEALDTVISYDPQTNKELTRVYKRPYSEAEIIKLYPHPVEVIDTVITYDDQSGKETIQIVKSKMIEAYQLLIARELQKKNPDMDKLNYYMKRGNLK